MSESVVTPADWHPTLAAAHAAGLTWFDHLTAVDEPHEGRIAVLVAVATPDVAERRVVRTHVPRDGGALPTLTDLWAGAGWPEREAFEMLGVRFEGHPGLAPLLLAPGAPLHPLRREVLLAPRQQTPWPGEKDPADRREGEGPPARAGSRRRLLPPGVDPGRGEGA